MACSTR